MQGQLLLGSPGPQEGGRRNIERVDTLSDFSFLYSCLIVSANARDCACVD